MSSLPQLTDNSTTPLMYSSRPSSKLMQQYYSTVLHHLPKTAINKLAHYKHGNRTGKVTIATGYWNCARGLLDSNNNPTPKLDEIELFLDTHKLDILAIAEAGLHGSRSRTVRARPVTTNCIMTALHIPGFSIILPKSWVQHDTARLFLYVKDTINYKVISSNVNASDLPTISIEARKGMSGTTIISAHYREFTGGISGLDNNNAQLERLVRQTEIWKQLHLMQKDLIILGDTNLCYRKWSAPSHPQSALTNRIKEVQAEAALHQLVNIDTRLQVVDGVLQRSIIDHIYTNCSASLLPVEVVPVGTSDHQGLVARKVARVQQVHPKTFRSRDHSNLVGLVSSIHANNISNLITSCTTLEEAAATFNREVLYYTNIFCPIRTVVVKGAPKPYITQPTKDLIKEKARALSAARTNNCAANLTNYKRMTKAVQKAVQKDKKDWIEEDLGPLSSPKAAWSRARLLLGQPSVTTPASVMIGTSLESNPAKIAEAYANLHLSKVQQLRAQAPTTPSRPPADRVRQWLAGRDSPAPAFSFKPINMLTLDKLISRIKPGKGLPSDTIDGTIFKAIAPIMKDALLHIVNLSLTTGKFSTQWKEQIMQPRHKRGSKDDLSNYRPVSTIIEIAKLTETAAHDQVRDHFVANSLLHPGHHGGIPKLDTTTALLEVQKFNLQAAEAKKLTGTVLLDQSAAFDLMDHVILVEKLKAYNFDQTSIDWFSSYLSERSFRVQIDSKRSPPHTIGPFAVPQGSVLGCLLFIISQNDLPAATTDNSTDSQTICFVDDETEQVADSNPARLQVKLQERVDNAVLWLKDNKMVISPEKTKLLISMTKELRAVRHPNIDISITVDSKVISPTPSEKLLGIVICQDMTWIPHLWGETWRPKDNHPGLIPSLLQRLGLLRHLSRFSSRPKMKSFVPAMIISRILYALPLTGSLWGIGGYSTNEPQKTCFRKQDIIRLQTIQRSALLLTLPPSPNQHYVPTLDLLAETGDMSIHQMIAYTTLALSMRINQSGRPPDLATIFSPTSNTRTRSTLITIPRFKLNISLESYLNQAPRLMNLLPDHITPDLPANRLKSSLKQWVKSNIRSKV